MRRKTRKVTLQRETLNRMNRPELRKANGGNCETTKCTVPPGCTTTMAAVCTNNCSDVCSFN